MYRSSSDAPKSSNSVPGNGAQAEVQATVGDQVDGSALLGDLRRMMHRCNGIAVPEPDSEVRAAAAAANVNGLAR